MRFDSCDLNECKIENITIFHKQGYYTNEKYSNDSEFYIFSGSNFKNHQLCYDGCNKINMSEKDSKAFAINKGDILLVRSGNVGDYAIVEDDTKKSIFGSYLIKFILNQRKVINRYFGYFYESPAFRKRLLKIVQASANTNINAENIKSVFISFPKLESQYKIASFFDLVDKRIETQNKIICKYESLIKGISEIYFNKEPNKFIRIKDLILFGKAGGTPSSFVSEYYDGNIPFLSIADITKEGKYISSTEKCLSEKGLKNSSAWIVPKDSLILSMYASVGLTCINKVQLSTSQAMFSMVLENYEDVEYLYYYLNYFRLTKIHRLLETGTQSNINADTIKGIKIPFYKNKTIFIKTMLRIEECIENEKRMLAALLKQKTFLLKNMFI